MHIVTCGRTIVALSRQLSCLRFVLISPLPFGLLMVWQARQATRFTTVTDHHNIHQAVSDPANITFIQKVTSLQTTLFCHIIRMGPSKHNILGSHYTEHSSFDIVNKAHGQTSSRKYGDVRTAVAVYEYR
jgi:hypothetical protein